MNQAGSLSMTHGSITFKPKLLISCCAKTYQAGKKKKAFFAAECTIGMVLGAACR